MLSHIQAKELEMSVLDYLVSEGFEQDWIQVFANRYNLTIPTQPNNTLVKNYYSIVKLQKRLVQSESKSGLVIPAFKKEWKPKTMGRMTCLASKESLLACGDENGRVCLFDMSVGFDESSLLSNGKEHKSAISCLAWSHHTQPHELLFASCCQDLTIKIWSRNSTDSCFQPILTINGAHENTVSSLVFSRNGNTLYSASKDNFVHEWNISNATCQSEWAHTDWVRSIDGNTEILASACTRNIYIWDLNTKKCLNILKGHEHIVQQVLLLHDSNSREHNSMLYSCSRDCSIRIWNYKLGIQCHLLSHHTNWVSCIQLYEQEGLVSVGEDGVLCIWDVVNKKLVYSLEAKESLNVLGIVKDRIVTNNLLLY